jgi:septum site-determining protein MinC
MGAKPLELKGRMLSLTRVRVVNLDLAGIESQLREFARQMPQAVQGMPVLLDSDQPIDIGGVLSCLKNVGMQPLAAVDGPLAESARNWGLPVVAPDSGSGRAARAPVPENAAAAASAGPATYKPARIVGDPVRGGQQIYVQDADVIVTNMVSPGAEVIADGCVHVYGALRGRAIAGARGDTGARIFCRRFEAELVAIAGVYAVAEQMQGELRGKPVMAWLDGGKLKMDRLDW